MSCWSCKSPVGQGPFCGCGAIQAPVPGLDPFAVLGVPRGYVVDGASLEKTFKDLSRKLHPDRFAKADPRSRRYSLERATQLNDAYKILKSPVRRAEQLLKLAGMDVADEKEGGKQVDPAFLMDMMEQREALAEAHAAGDRGRLESMAAEMRTRKAAALKTIEDGFSLKALDEVAQALIALRYYDRFLEEVEAGEEGSISHG